MKCEIVVIIKYGPGQDWQADIPAAVLADAAVAAPVLDRDAALGAVVEQVLGWLSEHTGWTAAEDFQEVTSSVGTAQGGQVLVIKNEAPVPIDPDQEAARQAAEDALGPPGTLGYLRRVLARLEHLPDELPVVLAAAPEGNGFRRLGDVGDGDDPEPAEDDFGVPHPDDYEGGELPPPCLLLWPS